MLVSSTGWSVGRLVNRPVLTDTHRQKAYGKAIGIRVWPMRRGSDVHGLTRCGTCVVGQALLGKQTIHRMPL